MHFAGFDYTYFSFISPDDVLDYLINYVIELLDDDFTNNLKKKFHINHLHLVWVNALMESFLQLHVPEHILSDLQKMI